MLPTELGELVAGGETLQVEFKSDERKEFGGRARRYLLSSSTYRKLASGAGYVRVRAFDEPQQAQMILNHVDANGSISRSEAAELCGTNPPENARRILLKLRDDGGTPDRRCSTHIALCARLARGVPTCPESCISQVRRPVLARSDAES